MSAQNPNFDIYSAVSAIAAWREGFSYKTTIKPEPLSKAEIDRLKRIEGMADASTLANQLTGLTKAVWSGFEVGEVSDNDMKLALSAIAEFADLVSEAAHVEGEAAYRLHQGQLAEFHRLHQKKKAES